MKLVVLGMHRSGNSALTGLLSLMGAHTGSVVMSRHADETCPGPAFEQIDCSSLNEALLNSVDCKWHLVNTFSVSRLSRSAIDSFNVRAKSLLADFDGHESWVISDPALCLLFPLWQPLVPDCICIHLYRNPIEVAGSLQALAGMPMGVGIALWEKYTRAALYATREQLNLFVSHKRLMTRPEIVVQELLAQLSAHGMDGLSAPASQDIDAVIDAQLYRQKVSDDDCAEFLNMQQARLFQGLLDGSLVQETVAKEVSGGARLALQEFELGRYAPKSAHHTGAGGELQGKTAEKGVRYRRQLDAFQEKSSVWLTETASLQSVMERLVSGVSAMTGSNTWKIVARLIIARQKLLGRKIAPSAVHSVSDAISDYESWKEGWTARKERIATENYFGDLALSNQQALRYFPTVDILVCVHNALDEVKCCLNSVIENTHLDYTLYIVNDGSGQETSDFLREFKARHPATVLLQNEQAGGYTKAANRGLRACAAEYVVCVNSDTVVPRLWLEGLIECAESDPAIGIIGPLSNAASWQSVPERFDQNGDWAVNELPTGMDVNQMAELVFQVSEKSFPRVDFVNGFCFAIKRVVIDAIGYLDEEAFPQGYGEENDYCLRAAAAGFRLAIADQTYVYHAKSKSYSHEKRRALSKKGGAALQKKHGAISIDRGVAALKSNRELGRARAHIRHYLQDGFVPERPERAGLPSILYVVSTDADDRAYPIVEEVAALRAIGVWVRVAWLASNADELQRLDPSIAMLQECSLFIANEDDLGTASEGVDLIVVDSSRSLQLLKPLAATNRRMRVAYRVNGYEPRTFEKGTADWRSACESYTCMDNICLFAETDRLRQLLLEHHGVSAWRLYPELESKVDNSSPSAVVTRAAVLSMLSICRSAMAQRDIRLHRARAVLQMSSQRPLVVAIWPCVMRVSSEPTGSAYIRLIEPLESKSLGDRVRLVIVHSVGQLKEQAADICIVQRNAIADEPVINELFAYCQNKHVPVVHEIDDDLFNPGDNDQAVLDDRELRALHVMAARSNAVITSTPQLQRLLRTLNVNVFCIQSALSNELWCRDQLKPGPAGERPVRFLYMGTRTHGQDLAMVETAWRRIEEKYGANVCLDVIGGAPVEDLKFGNAIAIPASIRYPQFVQWLKTQGPWDIGLIPLRDTSFNRKKSHIKFLDYSALSLAIVCSDVPTYRDIARDEENAILVSNSSDKWVEAMARLIEDPDLRCKLGKEAYSGLIENYCLERRATDLLDTLLKVVNG